MKKIPLATFILFSIGALSAAEPPKAAPGPRATFNALVEKAKKNPADQELRKQVIEAAKKLNPAPAVPEEAERRLARGTAAVSQAQKPEDFRLAVTEFEQATLAAPWLGSAYYNLAVAQDKAEDFDGALANVALAELALPADKDVKTLRYQIEFRRENSPAAKAKKDAALIASLNGAIFRREWTTGMEVQVKIQDNTLLLMSKRLENRVCLCNTEDCNGPIGEVKICKSTGLSGRFAEILPDRSKGDNVTLHFEIAPDGESINESSFYYEFKRLR